MNLSEYEQLETPTAPGTLDVESDIRSGWLATFYECRLCLVHPEYKIFYFVPSEQSILKLEITLENLR